MPQYARIAWSAEAPQEWLGHTSTAHTRAYIDAEDYREKANGVVAELDMQIVFAGGYHVIMIYPPLLVCEVIAAH